MSEYWISQKKYYCTVCQVYMSDNKVSRQLHDNGNKHKEKVAQLMKKKREDKLHGARSEQDLKKQLAEIERAARGAIAEDRVQSGNLFRLNEPGAPPLPNSLSSTPYSSSNQRSYQPVQSDQVEGDDNDNRGIYTVDGQTYLEGKKFEHKIYGGTQCQIFDEAADEWMDGEVTRRIEAPIPNTDMYILSFDVSYSRMDAKDGENIVEKGVKSDRIRLKGTPDGELLNPTWHPSLPPPKPKIDENTGVGMWQTVSVQVVDEEEEQRRRDHSAIDAALAGDPEADAKPGERTTEDETHHADSALSAYDPYHTKIYKGIKLIDVVVTNAEVDPTYCCYYLQ